MATIDTDSAAQRIQTGAVIAYPTEAVWGLGCDPTNNTAIQRILTLKDRPWQKGLVVVAADFKQLEPWLLPLTEQENDMVQSTWPGPITWVLPCKSTVSKWLKGEHDTLAVRVSAHPLVRELCLKTGPLVSTSANPAGKEPARSLAEVEQYFESGLDAIVEGALGGNAQPSEIRTLDGKRLR